MWPTHAYVWYSARWAGTITRRCLSLHAHIYIYDAHPCIHGLTSTIYSTRAECIFLRALTSRWQNSSTMDIARAYRWQLCNDVWPRVERKRSSPKWKLCWDGTPILSANPYSHLTACLVGLKWTDCIWTQCINLKVEVWWLRRSAAGTRGLSIAGTQCRCFSNGPISFGQLRMAISHRL